MPVCASRARSRPGRFAETLLGLTSRPITRGEQESWAPRVSTPRHQPLHKPAPRDPIFGVPLESVRDLPSVEKFKTSSRTFAEEATRFPPRPATMVSPAASDQARSKHKVDPRGPYKVDTANTARVMARMPVKAPL